MSSILNQRVAIWREDDIVENIEVDRSYYKVEISRVGTEDFDRNLTKIPPCYATKDVYTPKKDAIYFLNPHTNYTFIWVKERVESQVVEEGSLPPTRWTIVDENEC